MLTKPAAASTPCYEISQFCQKVANNVGDGARARPQPKHARMWRRSSTAALVAPSTGRPTAKAAGGIAARAHLPRSTAIGVAATRGAQEAAPSADPRSTSECTTSHRPAGRSATGRASTGKGGAQRRASRRQYRQRGGPETCITKAGREIFSSSIAGMAAHLPAQFCAAARFTRTPIPNRFGQATRSFDSGLIS